MILYRSALKEKVIIILQVDKTRLWARNKTTIQAKWMSTEPTQMPTLCDSQEYSIVEVMCKGIEVSTHSDKAGETAS